MKNSVKVWMYIGLTLPFTALTGIGVTYYIGWGNYLQTVLSTIMIIFITIGVFWWWWAMYYIHFLTRLLMSSQEKFKEVKEELSEIRKFFR